MKKLFTLIIFVQLAVSAMAAAWDGTTSTNFTTNVKNASINDGTPAKPYLISSPEELYYLSVNISTYKAKCFKLDADIDLGSFAWTPIGDATNKYAGVFDGNYHTISNIYINITTGTLSANGYVGIFGYVAGTSGTNAIIKNLTLSSGSV
ncbi:MAG: hypothetical protein WCJ61_15145, partial [Paludibacter sp.]